MIGDALKLSAYFGDSLTTGTELASDALMRCLAEQGVRVATLVRGVEGFGVNRRIHAERFPDISTDLPLLAMAVDEHARIEMLLEDVDRALPRGLVTLEHARLATGDDVARATFPEGSGAAAKLTVYCGRGETVGGRQAYREVVHLLRRQGAAGSIVLLGVDGVVDGRRHKARLLAANADTPLLIISVGQADVLERCLPHIGGCLRQPIVTLERISQLKHDGELLEPPPTLPADSDVWHTLRIYTRQSAQVNGRSLYSELTRRLREVGAAGVTTILGEWGFSSDEHPYGDRLGRFASHSPSYTVYIDRPRKVAEVWPVVDDITAEHGIVTWLVVPGYRERAIDAVHGDLPLAAKVEPAAWSAAQDGGRGDTVPVAPASMPPGPDAAWVSALAERAHGFARSRGRHEPLVRITLADGERFFLAAAQSGPGEGFVTLHPHPERYDEMLLGDDGTRVTPRAIIVPRRSIAKIELLSSTPRGSRSLVGFRSPEQSATGSGPGTSPAPESQHGSG